MREPRAEEHVAWTTPSASQKGEREVNTCAQYFFLQARIPSHEMVPPTATNLIKITHQACPEACPSGDSTSHQVENSD